MEPKRGRLGGMGVAAYTLDGDKRGHALEGEPVAWVQSVGGYAYVVGGRSRIRRPCG